MIDWRSISLSRQNKAVLGSVALHIAAGTLLMTWRALPLPIIEQNIPIELVEASVTELPQERTVPSELVLVPEGKPLPPEPDVLQTDVPGPSEPAPIVPKVDEPAQIAEVLPPSEISLLGEIEEEREQLVSEASIIDGEEPGVALDELPSEYVYAFNPFAETAPTTLARVSKAVNCARVNRETRPDFCPNYDENDLYLASLTENRPDNEWAQVAYDPVRDAAAALSALGRFSASQDTFSPNGRSEVGRTDFDKVVIPDADCRAIGFGFENTVSGQPGHDVSIPDSKAVYCH